MFAHVSLDRNILFPRMILHTSVTGKEEFEGDEIDEMTI
jgi:hypothetical protein